MAATDFFSTTKQIREYAPYFEAAKPIDQLEFAFRDPEAKLKNILGEETYNQLKDHFAGETENATLDEGVKYLQGALANLAVILYYVMDAPDRNREDQKIYRYQEEEQKAIFRDTGAAEISQLLTLLDENIDVFTDWASTDMYTTREAQIIKTHREFGKYYFIDGSAYFFSRLVFLMKEVTQDRILPVVGDYSDLDESTDTEIIDQVKKTLAYLTMAMALRRFDFVELPRTIRNNAGETNRTVRTGGQEVDAVRDVADEIELKGNQYLGILAIMMEKKRTGTLEEPEEINDEENNFYLQT